MGTIYLRGSTYWIQYHRSGKAYRESSRSHRKGDAERLLKAREGQIAEGRFSGLRIEKILFDELAEDFLNDYRLKGRKSLARAERSVRILSRHFGRMKAADIDTGCIEGFILARQKGGTANGTINRELAALKRMFRLGITKTPPKVNRPPHVPMLKESRPREGFFTREDFKALMVALPAHLRPVLAMGYHTGMRKEEILSLQWDQVDFVRGSICLQAGTTKNGESRTIALTEELFNVLREQRLRRDERHPECPWVFSKDGKRILDFRGAWEGATRKVGLEGKLFHDLRRTAVRNLIRAGVPEVVAMRISGHKTRSVFDRYNIVNEDDLQEAAKQLERFHHAEDTEAESQWIVTKSLQSAI